MLYLGWVVGVERRNGEREVVGSSLPEPAVGLYLEAATKNARNTSCEQNGGANASQETGSTLQGYNTHDIRIAVVIQCPINILGDMCSDKTSEKCGRTSYMM